MPNENFKTEDRSQKLNTKISLLLNSIASIPKTLYFNFKCFPLSMAIKLPVLISYRTKIIELRKNTVIIKNKPFHFMVKIGFGGSESIARNRSTICLEKGSIITFHGKATFAEGISLRNLGTIHIGNNFFSNKNCIIWCSNRINIGNDALFGWNVLLRDSDGHLILENKKPHPVCGEILIGNNCWICSNASLLKNSGIGSNSVLGYGSILTKVFDTPHSLYVGIPAKKIKENIDWVHGE